VWCRNFEVGTGGPRENRRSGKGGPQIRQAAARDRPPRVPKGRSYARSRMFATLGAYHRPPRAVAMPRVQRLCNLPKRPCASFLGLADDRQHVGRVAIRLGPPTPRSRSSSPAAKRGAFFEATRPRWWPALKPLPASPYVLAEWRIRRVSLDYHVEVEKHYYSVPHRFVRAEVEVRFTARTVEILPQRRADRRASAHER